MGSLSILDYKRQKDIRLMQIGRQIVLMESLLKKKAHELESKEVVIKMTFIYNNRKALVIFFIVLRGLVQVS